jgi:adenylate cyclase class IV
VIPVGDPDGGGVVGSGSAGWRDPNSSRNLETKARWADLGGLARQLDRAGARFGGRLTQTDTYFAVPEARLKLREYTREQPDGRAISGAELIRYERPDDVGARLSDYVRTSIDDPPACRLELAERHGIRGVVRKRRDLWLLDSTRIHLDSVEGLGEFVELETVYADGSEAAYAAEHERIRLFVGIEERDLVAGSYIDEIAP